MKQNSESQKRLLSQKEAAEYLGISYWTLRDLIFQGILAHLRIGRRVLLDIQDLEEYIRQGKTRPGT